MALKVPNRLPVVHRQNGSACPCCCRQAADRSDGGEGRHILGGGILWLIYIPAAVATKPGRSATRAYAAQRARRSMSRSTLQCRNLIPRSRRKWKRNWQSDSPQSYRAVTCRFFPPSGRRSNNAPDACRQHRSWRLAASDRIIAGTAPPASEGGCYANCNCSNPG